MHLVADRTLLLQSGNHCLHILGAVAASDKNRVVGLHYHQVIHPEGGNQGLLCRHQAVVAVDAQHLAARDIAVGVLVEHFPQGLPRTHIAPARIEGNDHCMVGFFHHRVIHRVAAAVGKGIAVNPDKIAFFLRPGQGVPATGQDVRGKALQLLDIARGAEHEHAAVPVVLATGDKIRSALRIGFFHKAGNGECVFQSGVFNAATDIAVTGFGFVSDDAKGYQSALRGRFSGESYPGMEGSRIADHMVSGQHQHQRIIVVSQGMERRQRDCRSRVAAMGFEQNTVRSDAKLVQLLGHDKAVIFVADHQGRKNIQASQPLHGFLNQRVVRRQGQKLLGVGLARLGPKPRAAAAGENYWNHAFL